MASRYLFFRDRIGKEPLPGIRYGWIGCPGDIQADSTEPEINGDHEAITCAVRALISSRSLTEVDKAYSKKAKQIDDHIFREGIIESHPPND
jgi:hypothetical protein